MKTYTNLNEVESDIVELIIAVRKQFFQHEHLQKVYTQNLLTKLYQRTMK